MCCYLFKCLTTDRKITNKKILVIGGTQGLGKSIALILKKSQNDVCIAARNIDKVENDFSKFCVDITDTLSFPRKKSEYDYIFCCAGNSIPGFINDLKMCDYKNQMDVNYLGTLNSLFHYRKYNKKPFKFIMISSTTAFFTFPGYSAYSPSKAALKNFFDSAFLEFKNEDIELFIYYPNSILTPGLETENRRKPVFTQEIEGRDAMHPDVAANILLHNMGVDNEICSDFLTKIFKTKSESKNIVESFYFMLSILVYPIALIYTKYKYKKIEGKKED